MIQRIGARSTAHRSVARTAASSVPGPTRRGRWSRP
jgi:hypothetical protein